MCFESSFSERKQVSPFCKAASYSPKLLFFQRNQSTLCNKNTVRYAIKSVHASDGLLYKCHFFHAYLIISSGDSIYVWAFVLMQRAFTYMKLSMFCSLSVSCWISSYFCFLQLTILIFFILSSNTY